jgi:glycosyltransferase involved in cell wall biosynthesis
MHLISIIIPCYNEQEALPFLFEELKKLAVSMPEQDFEFVFVNDGSRDNTLSVFKDLRRADSRVRFLSFSRNFGKEAAIYAGMEASKGDYVAMIDADLQDPPSLIKGMYHTLQTEDYDCVATRRTDRKGEPKVRSFFAKMFYRLINRISDTKMVDGARDFRLMTRQMVDAILELKEYNRFSKGIFGWVGFNTKWIEYENVERVAGNTKWSFWGLFFYSLEGIIAFSTKPLILASISGFFFFFVSVVMIIYIVIKRIMFYEPVAGYASTVCLIFFIGGIQLLCLGILGQYLSKLYLEAKRRPVYIVKETEEDEQ